MPGMQKEGRAKRLIIAPLGLMILKERAMFCLFFLSLFRNNTKYVVGTH